MAFLQSRNFFQCKGIHDRLHLTDIPIRLPGPDITDDIQTVLCPGNGYIDNVAVHPADGPCRILPRITAQKKNHLVRFLSLKGMDRTGIFTQPPLRLGALIQTGVPVLSAIILHVFPQTVNHRFKGTDHIEAGECFFFKG